MADPPYLDTATGAITDGEAWVFIETNTVTSATITQVDFTSGEGTKEFSQYTQMVMIGYFQFNHTGAGDDWGPLSVIVNDNTSASTRGSRIYGKQTSPGVAGVDYTNGRIPMGYYTNSQASVSDAFGAFYLDIYHPGSGHWKNMQVLGGSDRDGNGFITQNIGSIFDQNGVEKISLIFGGTYASVNSRFDLFGILPRLVNA